MNVLNCVFDSWGPHIGDPTVQGWVVTLAYAVAAGLCVRAGPGTPRGERRFWILTAILMAGLCLNKQLDLQSGVTEVGKCVARAQDWYSLRRSVQAAFVGLVAALGLLALAATAVAMRRHLRRVGPAILGLVCLFGYAAVSAAGFNHVDTLVPPGLAAGIRASPLVELTGILLVAGTALRRARVHWRTRARR